MSHDHDHKRTVRGKYPNAGSDYVEKQHVYRVDEGVLVGGATDPAPKVLGIGVTQAGAWEDAARNVSRAPIPTVALGGIPTWSTKDDEKYWKDKAR